MTVRAGLWVTQGHRKWYHLTVAWLGFLCFAVNFDPKMVLTTKTRLPFDCDSTVDRRRNQSSRQYTKFYRNFEFSKFAIFVTWYRVRVWFCFISPNFALIVQYNADIAYVRLPYMRFDFWMLLRITFFTSQFSTAIACTWGRHVYFFCFRCPECCISRSYSKNTRWTFFSDTAEARQQWQNRRR